MINNQQLSGRWSFDENNGIEDAFVINVGSSLNKKDTKLIKKNIPSEKSAHKNAGRTCVSFREQIEWVLASARSVQFHHQPCFPLIKHVVVMDWSPVS